MNPVDALTLALIVIALVLGWRSGAIPQVMGLLGAIGGGALAILLLPHLADPLSGVDPSYRPLVVLVILVAAVGLGESIGSAIGRSIAVRLGTGFAGAADRTVGAGLGVVQVLLIVWLAGGLFIEGPVPRLAEAAGGSTAVRTLSSILPPATEVATGLGGWIDSTGLPDVFVGFEPIPAPAVDRPSDPTARAIAAAAEASTAKVSAATCGLESVGSGFVVAPHYIVTNAHVVAGAGRRGIRAKLPSLGPVDATVVLFDPSFDVAVLYVPALDAPALRFAAADPDRGAVGATLGYPAGGPLTILPVAVSARYSATGYDIYGTSQVRRQIVELRADIAKGDSGGPLVLQDGTVGGVVFAEARTDPTVGYALSPTEVAVRIAPGLGRTSPIGTGACIAES